MNINNDLQTLQDEKDIDPFSNELPSFTNFRELMIIFEIHNSRTFK